MEHRPADGGARQGDGGKDRRGGHRPGTAHLDLDIQQGGLLLLRRVFVGDGPAGEFCGGTKDISICKVIHLYDCPVDAEGVCPAVFPDALDVLDDLLDIPIDLVLRDDLKAQGPQEVQGIAVGIQCFPLDLLDVKDKDIQPPLGGDLGIFLPQGAGGGVAGVLEGLLPRQLLGLHHPLETLRRHVDLPPDLQQRQGDRQLQRHRADGADVLADILPGKAVAPGGAHRQHPVPVLQGDRKAVDLGLHHVGGLRDSLPHPAVEVPQFVKGKDVLKGAHLDLVLHRGEGVGSGAPHPHRGRRRGSVLGIGLLQVQQLVKQPVVLKVADLRVVLVVVPVGMVLHLGPECFDLL